MLSSQLFADVISQSIYAVYARAFPLSIHRFDDNFRQYLIDTIHNWVVGQFCHSLNCSSSSSVVVQLHSIHLHIASTAEMVTKGKRFGMGDLVNLGLG